MTATTPRPSSDRKVGARAVPLGLGAVVALVGLLATWFAGALVSGHHADEVADALDAIAADMDADAQRRLDAVRASLLTLAAGRSTGAVAESELSWLLANTGVVEETPGLLAVLYADARTADEGGVVVPQAIHPFSPNIAVLGRDITREPERRRAIAAARDTGSITATSVVTHVDGGVDAILVMAPAYDGGGTTILERRAEFAGVMIGVLSPDELFSSVSRSPVRASLLDRGAAGALLPQPVPVWSQGTDLGGTARTYDIAFADRLWELTLAPGPGFVERGDVLVAVWAGGIAVSLLLGALVGVWVGRKRRLEETVVERTRELRHANEQLRRAGVLRSQFIATVSHELRTPLTSVIGFVQTLRRMDGLDGMDPSMRDDFLARAERNGLTLRRMIEELLDFGRLERGELDLDLEVVDVGAVVGTIAADLRPALGARPCVVDVPHGILAEVDVGALHRILANVLSNAIRYGVDDGPVELTVRVGAGNVEIVCGDRGPGFDPDDLPRLMERFVRGAGVMGQGTGLGLALVRELAVAHGGACELRNRPGGGAEVVVRLPTVRMSEPPADDGVAPGLARVE